MSHVRNNIIHVRHPHYLRDQVDWEKWRDTFNGGEYYRDKYLVKFGKRETGEDFKYRRALTPISSFAKSALIDVRNNIYQRLVGVTRVGGSQTYQKAIVGDSGGVNGQGSTMDSFIGDDVLTELLLMGRVGCYVDAAPPTGPTLADQAFPPYLTAYRVEDILTYTYAPRGLGGEFSAVLLRDWNLSVNSFMGMGGRLSNLGPENLINNSFAESAEVAGLPSDVHLPMGAGSHESFRLVWKDDLGQVWFKLFDHEGNVRFTRDSLEDGRVLTGLQRVPFVLFDIGQSLMKDVASYQHALLNLGSNDVYYALKSNSPFLTIQRDQFASGDHLKKPATAEGGKGSSEDVGSGKGRYYGINEERPGYIAPPTDPLKASMQLQDKLEDNIRTLINLAIAAKAGSRTESAEAKRMNMSGLEAGLSFIGLALEEGEKLISQMWAEYESTESPDYATVNYPDRYTLKDDMQRLDEASKQIDLIERLPTQELKKVVSKDVVVTLLGGKVAPEEINKIFAKIDSNDYILSDPDMILAFHKEGLVDDITASEAGGFNAEEVVPQAREDRAERIALTLAAQTPREEQGMGDQTDGSVTNPASRGAPELDTNPQSGEDEKDTTNE